MIDRKLVFKNEISWIQNDSLREIANDIVLKMLPEYFFYVAASSTGKYHPSYALGEGGLVRHTKAALKIAHELFNLEQYQKIFSTNIMDCLLIAIMFHDGWKHGEESEAGKFTTSDHPVVAARILEEYLKDKVSDFELSVICSCIKSHMGQWNTDYKTKKEIMPKPETSAQEFVHLCDYIASRKYLIFDFGDEYYTPTMYDHDSVSKEEIDALISLCKNKIAEGIDRELLYSIIEKHSNGVRNPNRIKDRNTYDAIKNEISSIVRSEQFG